MNSRARQAPTRRQVPRERRGWVVPWMSYTVALVVLCASVAVGGFALTGCGGKPAVGPPGGSPQTPGLGAPPPTAATQVPTALYFAHKGKLQPTFRSLTTTEENAPRAALESLIAGPTAVEERRGLEPVLASSVRIVSVRTENGAAVIELDGKPAAGANEEMALDAIYLTMAQFPGVDEVKVMAEGVSKTLDGGVPVLQVPARQQVGERASGLRLKSVRWWAHPSVFRLVFEVEKADGSPAGTIPAATGSYSPSGQLIEISLSGMGGSVAEGLAPGDRLDLADWRAATLSWKKTADAKTYSFALGLQPDRSYGWRMWSLADPARVVVDVFAAGPRPDKAR